MIEHVIDNVSGPEDKVYLIILLEHTPYLSSTNLPHRGNVAIIPQQGRLQGAVETVMLAKGFINNSEPLIIANSDQYVKYNKEAWRRSILNNDASIMTFEADDPKWSYAKVDSNNMVTEVAEKVVISNLATVGVYGYRRGSFFVEAAEQMMRKDIRTNGEFYVCPSMNEMLDKQIVTFDVDKMFGCGTPSDLELNYNYVGE